MTNFFEWLWNKKPIDVLIVKDDSQALKAKNICTFFGIDSFALSDFRGYYLDDLRSFTQEITDISQSLYEYYVCKKKKILILPIATSTKFFPVLQALDSFDIALNTKINTQELQQRLSSWGYVMTHTVEQSGECSFRGDIIDIFSPRSEHPYRIELFDDEVESIRQIDIVTQKSHKKDIQTAQISSALFSLSDEKLSQLNTLVANADVNILQKDILSLGFWFLQDLGLGADLKTGKCYFAQDFSAELGDIYEYPQGLCPKQSFDNVQMIDVASSFKPIKADDPKTLIDFHKDKKIHLLASNEMLLKKFDIQMDFVQSSAVVNFIGKNDLIISLNEMQKAQQKRRARLDIDELNVGDYVVHEQYGIGVFNGLEQTSVMGMVRDFVSILYQNDDKLLLPVDNLHLIDRFVSNVEVPAIDRLGKTSFIKLKQKAKEKLFAIAHELVNRAAKRSVLDAPSIVRDHLVDEFQTQAGFTYTLDQTKNIDSILDLMSKSTPMHYLLSGDVGFGKSEVSLNAIFACVMNGYSSLVLVPTGLLCTQQHSLIKQRLKPYSIEVFRYDASVSAKAKALAVEYEKPCVIVGTHALLNADPKNLGLIVIDEEHRFGVKQKEAIKEKTKSVHILSMSATPIPRSLNMALLDVLSYGMLSQAPQERKNVRTIVEEFSNALLKEAILRERRRNGQVFIVHNKISELERKAKDLQELVRDLRILVLHAKTGAKKNEQEMAKFIRGEYDLLLSTTIIESGIHIPNANTIIINNAHRFGLADLHQLRGRVGRSSKQGYCYYLVDDKDSITQNAKKRLLALERHSFLGSGGVLARNDLEIRGAGNILGAQQSGQIKYIGYSLYLKMLENAILELSNKNTSNEEDQKTEVKLAISAYISSSLVYEDSLRIELYRRLSKAKTPAQIFSIAHEMHDRFGTLDEPTKNFIELMDIRLLCLAKGIQSVSSVARTIYIKHHTMGVKTRLEANSHEAADLFVALKDYLHDV